MHKRAVKYKDTWAAPGSALFDALERGDREAAERIYQQCEREARALLDPKLNALITGR